MAPDGMQDCSRMLGLLACLGCADWPSGDSLREAEAEGSKQDHMGDFGLRCQEGGPSVSPWF